MTSEKTRGIPPSAQSAAPPQDMGHAPTVPRARGIKRTRAGELWVAAGFFAAILLLLIFIMENTQHVSIGYVGGYRATAAASDHHVP
jgi:uncharacterized integral membrane protein